MAQLSISTSICVLVSLLYTHSMIDISGPFGSTVTLPCQYTEHNRQNVTDKVRWEYVNKDGSTSTYSTNEYILPALPDELKTRLNITGNNAAGEYNLFITGLKPSDEGRYNCKRGFDGLIQVLLYIPEPPTSLFFSDLVNTSRIIGKEDQDLTVSCTAIGGKPQPEVTLKGRDDNTIYKTDTQTLSFTFPSINRSLDKKALLCVSNSSALSGQLTQAAEISLYLKPFKPLFSKELVTTENIQNSVSCTSTGSRPDGSIYWLLASTDITANSIQQVTWDSTTDIYTMTSVLSYTVDRRYNGQSLTCGAVNKIFNTGVETTKTINVTFAPDLSVSNVTYNQNTTTRPLTCTAFGNPPVYIYSWNHKSQYGMLIREWRNLQSPLLKLPDISAENRYQDSGQYVCTVSNGVTDKQGNLVQRTGSVYVTINALPVFTKDNSGSEVQFGEFGKNVMLFVNVYSVPKYTSKRWYKGNSELTSDKYVTSEEPTIVRDAFHGVDVQLDGYRVTLTINGLTQDDFDNYTLRFYSGFQYEEHMVMLVCASAPRPPTNFSITDVADFSITIKWIPGFSGGHQQTFHVHYRILGSVEWKLLDIPIDHNDQQSDFMSYTLTGLQDETTYELRMYADNRFNSSLPTHILNITTIQTAATDNKLAVGPVIGGVAGGLSLGVLLILAVVGITRYRGRNLFGQDTCTNFPHFSISCNRDTKDTKDNQRQYDNIGMTSNDSNYEEIENKGISKHIQETETDAKSYETLGVKEKPNIYDDLKTKGIGQFEEDGREYESLESKDKTKANQQIDRRQGKTDNIYENERF